MGLGPQGRRPNIWRVTRQDDIVSEPHSQYYVAWAFSATEEKADDRFHEQARLLGEVQASIPAQDAEKLQLLPQIEASAKRDSQPLASKSLVRPSKLNRVPLAPACVQRLVVMRAIASQLLSNISRSVDESEDDRSSTLIGKLHGTV